MLAALPGTVSFAGSLAGGGCRRRLVLRGAPAWMTVRVHDEMQAGDHDLPLLEVLEIDSTPAAPAMVFHRSRFKGLVEGDIAC